MTDTEYKNIISVIVVTYNEEATIGRALDSILCQKCHLPFEIVLGEDCSTDNTRAICEDYAKRFPDIIRLMEKSPNKGIIDNYFDCLLACRGRYIADCAGDDFWVDPLKLEKEVTVLENNPDVTLVHTDWMYYNEETKATTNPGINPFNGYITDGKRMVEAIITQTYRPIIHLCTAMYRTDVIINAYKADTKMFRNKDFGCEDLQICFIMAYNGNIAYLPNVTLHYSYGHETVSFSTNDKKQFIFVKRTTDLCYYLCNKYNIRSNKTDKFFKQRLFALLMHAFRSKSVQLYNEAQKYQKIWHTQNTLKISIAKIIMSSQFSWHILILARKLYVALKQKFRLSLQSAIRLLS